MYVDYFLSGAESVRKAIEICQDSKMIMNHGGFNLRKWKSNSKEVIEAINSSMESELPTTEPSLAQEDESYVKATTGPRDNLGDKHVKVLGTNWNTESDQFLFNFADLIDLARSLPVTKRSLLKLGAKIFDPLGLLSPFVVKLKILFQELCIQKIDWDEDLHGSMLSKWQSTLLELESLSQLRIPRCYFAETELKPSSIQLHGFSDASQRAYAAAVYLRPEYEDGRVQVELVASKTRVAPLKKQSIPRLELLGTTILARLMNTVQTSLPSEMKTF